MSALVVLLALVVAQADTAAFDATAAARARRYFEEGQAAYRLERWAAARKSFAMTFAAGRFAFGDDLLVAEAYHLATLSALRAGERTQAIQHAREQVAWAEKRRHAGWLARARVDVVEALLALDIAAAAESESARTAVAASGDRELELRLAELERQIARPADGSSPTPPAPVTPAAATPASPPAATRPTTLEDPKGDLVLVPAGDGAPAFWLDRHEVTNAQFAAYVASGHAAAGNWRKFFPAGGERLPVRAVTRADAEGYCRWADRRLPTEAEWLRAARGPGRWRYAFGDAFAPGRARVGLEPAAGPAAVGSFGSSPWGLDDLTGNVLEWCLPDDGDAATGVLRGGAWDSSPDDALSDRRLPLAADRTFASAGFRCARDAAASR